MYSDTIKHVGEDSDVGYRRGRYRCNRDDECNRCNERYRNGSQRRQSEVRERIWYNDM